MMRVSLLLLLPLLLGACAAGQPVDVNKRLEIWIGQDADALVRSWGPPDRSYEFKNGSTILEYDRNRIDASNNGLGRTHGSVVVGSDGSSIGIGAPLFMDGPGFRVRRCTVKFETNHQRIIKSTYHEGDNCPFALR